MRIRLIASLAASLALAACVAQAQRSGPSPAPMPVAAAPPAASGAGAAPTLAEKTFTAPRTMVSAANPLAVRAGLKVLREGGSAVDAAVAIQAVLGLVEPQSSGIGGGAFMILYDAKARKVVAYDGREVAPAGAGPDMFLGPDGKPVPFGQAVTSGRATGVPGAVAMLYAAQKDYGRLPWKDLFGEATTLAAEGFIVSPRLAGFLASGGFPQSNQPDVTAYFTKPDGTKYVAGDRLVNAPYADTLRRIATQGPDALLKGPTAQKIVARVGAAPLPSTMTLADLAGYKPKKTEALCRPFRVYVVCTPQLPSGGAAVLEFLGIIENTDIAAHKGDARGWFQFAEASRLMYADRDHFMGDPAFVNVPLKGLYDPAYLKARAALIGPTSAKTVAHGEPLGAMALGPDRTLEPGGTSSFAIMDADGNVLAMTTTVESIFGTGRMVDGFFLNNQLTDFSLAPLNAEGKPAANAVGPGKRPRSSMSPTIVMDRQGKFVMTIGSPGGNSILAYVSKVLVGTLEWKLPLPDAIGLPNVVARGDVTGLETSFDPAIAEQLKAMGVNVQGGRGEGSGLHGMEVVAGGVRGAADPRREGIALGF
ncbi:MAG: gamma-glutamyltransferase [Caulobacterales bacterium 32-69-10]|nr:MAG: gamma-glutamyltransferase [Caulobacterales bacterium 32-69-10]